MTEKGKIKTSYETFNKLGFVSIHDSVDEATQVVKAAKSGHRRVYKTQWPRFNKALLGGLEPSKFYIIAGRPGSGKSAFTNALIFSVNDSSDSDDFIFLYWNFEMSSYRQVLRAASSVVNKTLSELLSVNMILADKDFMNYTKAVEQFKSYPIYFNDIPRSVDFIYKTNKLISTENPDKQIINVYDHSRLVKGRSEGPEMRRLTELSLSCVSMQKEYHVINILLSQLNRNIESDERKKSMYQPMLTDLFGSDSIGQDPDVVMMINRPYDMYHITKPYIGENPKGLLALHLEKNRDGQMGMIPFEADLEHFKINEREKK